MKPKQRRRDACWTGVPWMLSRGTPRSSRGGGGCRGARHHFRVSVAAVVPGFLKNPKRFPGNFFDFYSVSTEASVGRLRAVWSLAGVPPSGSPPHACPRAACLPGAGLRGEVLGCAAARPPPPQDATAFLARVPFWRWCPLLHLQQVLYGLKANPPGTPGEFGSPAPIALSMRTGGGFNPIPPHTELPPGTSQPC